MTRREYLENKLAKRQQWATKAESRSDAASDAAHKIMDQIPLGQPILVGHHSERHARRDIARIDSAVGKSVEQHRLAEHHEEKAQGLARQLDHTIFSDDDDAIGALEARIAEREAKAQRMVETNKAWRKAKGDVATFAKLTGITEDAAAIVARTIEQAYSWEKQPYPAYQISNLRATIRSDKERIEQIKARAARTEKAEQAGGVVIEDKPQGYVTITFAKKPERSILNALKDAGFWWSGGAWHGKRDALPNDVAVMA